MNQNIETPRLKSKEEQEFWDKAFLAALGSHNNNISSLYGAEAVADRAIQSRRSRAQPKECGMLFGIDGFTCTRNHGHLGHCRNY